MKKLIATFQRYFSGEEKPYREILVEQHYKTKISLLEVTDMLEAYHCKHQQLSARLKRLENEINNTLARVDNNK